MTIAIANNSGAPIFAAARHQILVETGSEAIAGSTRMNAGTAQKIVLNLFSTAVMVKMGRVYRGLDGGYEREERQIAPPRGSHRQANRGCAEGDATRHSTGGRRRENSHLAGLGLEPREAAELLKRHGGNLRPRSIEFKRGAS